MVLLVSSTATMAFDPPILVGLSIKIILLLPPSSVHLGRAVSMERLGDWDTPSENFRYILSEHTILLGSDHPHLTSQPPPRSGLPIVILPVAPVCVDCLLFKATEPSPLQNSFSVRQKGGLPGPPTRNPCPRIHRCPGGLPIF